MSLDSDAFVTLCERLRALGAVKVEAGGFSAVFTVATPPQPPRGDRPAPSTEPIARLLSDAELREQAYAKELGL